MIKKHALGQRAHGGDISRKVLLPHMMEEVVDMAIYMETIMDQMDLLEDHLVIALDDRDWSLVEKACNILAVGNMEGVDEVELEGTKLPF
jgi:hypothetical protein